MPYHALRTVGALGVLLPLTVGGCRGARETGAPGSVPSASTPTAPAQPQPPDPTPPLRDDLAAKASAILIIKDANNTGGSKFHQWTAKTVRVLKAPSGVSVPADLHFAQYGWDPDVPSDTVVLYAIYFEEPPKNLRAIGWSPIK